MPSCSKKLSVLKKKIRGIHKEMKEAERKDISSWQKLCIKARNLAKAISDLEIA